MSLQIAQFSDTHLFSSQEQLHFGANVFNNLKQVLSSIADNETVDLIMFTGDLTQDHTLASYKAFVRLIYESNICKPVYFVSGNHDDPKIMAEQLVGVPFSPDSKIETEHWQLFILPSKSTTPSGFVDQSSLDVLQKNTNPNKYQWLFMHHHPINVGYFIDKHPLLNQQEFWQSISQQTSIKGISCGHVHQGLNLLKEETYKSCDVLTCPATSIQFDPSINGVAALDLGPGYRLLELHDDGSYDSEIIYL